MAKCIYCDCDCEYCGSSREILDATIEIKGERFVDKVNSLRNPITQLIETAKFLELPQEIVDELKRVYNSVVCIENHKIFREIKNEKEGN